MKRSSARLIIALLATAAIVALWSRDRSELFYCELANNSAASWHCHEAQIQLVIQIVITLLLAAAAWVWTRQIRNA